MASPKVCTGLLPNNDALADILDSDDSYLRMQPGFTLNSGKAPVWLVFKGKALTATSFLIESSAGTPGLTNTIDAWNWNASAFEETVRVLEFLQLIPFSNSISMGVTSIRLAQSVRELDGGRPASL